MKKIKALLIDTDTKQIREVEYDRDSLPQIYGLLNCSTIDIVNRKFMVAEKTAKRFDVICDDEGLLDPVKRKKPAILTFNFKNPAKMLQEVIVGNCLIVSHDGDGNSVSLTDEEIEGLKKFSMSKLKEAIGGQEVLVAEI